MTSEEKAYIAGIIDGEGTVTLTRVHRNEMPSPRVSVANNSLRLLKWIKERIGSGCITTRSKQQPQHAVHYVLNISDNRALNLLAEVKGYMIIKRSHAELLVLRYKDATPRNGKYTEEQLAKKLKLVEAIRALNRISRKGGES